MENIQNKIKTISDVLLHAFQPIVDTQSGTVCGFEALLRNYIEAGFESIDQVFDFAYANKNLFLLDFNLRKKAIQKLMDYKLLDKAILFYNLDNRILHSEDYQFGLTLEILSSYGIKADKICFEVSEKYYIECSEQNIAIMENYKKQGFKIAIDDFGVRFSGLEYIYHFEPDYVKIDRFFISDVHKNFKKKLFLENIVNLCSKLGISLIAEGIENIYEFKEIKDFGFSFAQGYFIEKPQIDLENVKMRYNHIGEIKNGRFKNRELILNSMKYIEPININDSINNCLYRFRDKTIKLLPVVDDKMNAMGVIMEKDLKEYAYSPYGKHLLTNKTYAKTIYDILTKTPLVSTNSKIENIIDNYVRVNAPDNSEMLPILVVENNKYVGYLDASTIIEIVHKYNLVRASNSNPLTKLPGNNLIREYMLEAKNSVFVYFDIDNFKAYNDTFGFRQGDRIILFLSDLLQKLLGNKGCFVGHVGGDDFFAGCDLSKMSFENLFLICKKVQSDFNLGIGAFYPKDILDQGFVVAKDRSGEIKQFSLVSVSFAILCKTENIEEEKLSNILAILKKTAKATHSYCAASCLLHKTNNSNNAVAKFRVIA